MESEKYLRASSTECGKPTSRLMYETRQDWIKNGSQGRRAGYLHWLTHEPIIHNLQQKQYKEKGVGTSENDNTA